MSRGLPPTLALAFALVLSLAGGAQTPLTHFEGNSPDDWMSLVVGGHDLDGDFVPDVVVGMPFGFSLAMSPDLDGDGIWDVVAGAPMDDFAPNDKRGSVQVLSGATGTTFYTRWGDVDGDWMGHSVAADFDLDFDGVGDFAGGAPYNDGSAQDSGLARMWSGANGAYITQIPYGGAGTRGGWSMSGVGDVDGNGFRDLLVGAPYHSSAGGTETGVVTKVGGSATAHYGESDFEHFGWSVASVGGDKLIGAPGYGNGRGRVRRLDGFDVVDTWIGNVGSSYGSSLASVDDLDGDGINEWLVGAPEVVSGGPGYVELRSGASGDEMFVLSGSAPGDEFGANVACVGDVDLDLRTDIAVGARLYHGTAGSNTGRVELFSTCAGPVTYCLPGLSASGCVASISGVGIPSATAQDGFLVSATGVEGNKDGLFFFGWNGRQANSWGNGSSYQCVVPPVKRGGLLGRVGAPGVCNGAFAQDMNAHWSANPNKNPGSGSVVQAQLWYRDPFNTSNQTTSFSNALEFVVCP